MQQIWNLKKQQKLEIKLKNWRSYFKRISVSKFDLRTLHGAGKYEFNITYRVDASPLSQNTVKIIGGTNNDVLVLAGTDGKKAECVKVIKTDEEPVRFEFEGNDCVKFECILLSKIK